MIKLTAEQIRHKTERQIQRKKERGEPMTAMSIKLPDEQMKHLRKMSHYLSLERDKNITLSDLVREALDQVYPVNDKIPAIRSLI
jgi:hypothetical protein